MSAPIYGVIAGADVVVAAATREAVLGIRAGSTFALQLKMVSIAFDQSGASAPTNEPVLVELAQCTFATNAPGTNSTSETPFQCAGNNLASGMTAASDWTALPTVLSVIDEFLIHPQSGIKEYYPLGDEMDSGALNSGFVLLVTAPNAVNCRPAMRVTRC